MPPHLFSVSDNAYQNMLQGKFFFVSMATHFSGRGILMFYTYFFFIFLEKSRGLVQEIFHMQLILKASLFTKYHMDFALSCTFLLIC